MNRSTARRAGLGAAVVMAALAGPLVAGEPVYAADPTFVGVNNGTLGFSAGAGQENRVRITLSGTTYTINDVFPIDPGNGCVLVPGVIGRVECSAVGVTNIRVLAFDGDDIVNNTTATRVVVFGGTGDDLINGGTGNDVISGEDGEDNVRGNEGNDVVEGGASDDRVSGGSGDDVLDGGTGQDIINGGPGAHDLVDYHTRTQPLVVDADEDQRDDGEFGEGDTVDENVEDINGGGGADILTGNGSDNQLNGLGGDDLLFGLSGDDTLRGGAGFNRIDGGPGADFCETSINPGGVLLNCNP